MAYNTIVTNWRGPAARSLSVPLVLPAGHPVMYSAEMAGTHRGQKVPLSIYHAVPAGWRSDEVIAQHAELHAKHQLIVPDDTEPSSPPWLPNRKEWLQYRAALYEVARGVAIGDPACIELAIRFIELRYLGSYSGFIREKLARRLANTQLTGSHKLRLHRHFEALVFAQERTQEFRAYAKLWRRIITSKQRTELLVRLEATHGVDAAVWLARKLGNQQPAA